MKPHDSVSELHGRPSGISTLQRQVSRDLRWKVFMYFASIIQDPCRITRTFAHPPQTAAAGPVQGPQIACEWQKAGLTAAVVGGVSPCVNFRLFLAVHTTLHHVAPCCDVKQANCGRWPGGHNSTPYP